MMKRISRATLRGKPLNEDCKRANRATHEYGKEDNRVYCYGLYTEFSDCDIREECYGPDYDHDYDELEEMISYLKCSTENAALLMIL